MATEDGVFCGLDVGTQGARCILVTERGRVLGEGECPYRSPTVAGLPEGWFEQQPVDWLEATTLAVRRALNQLQSSTGRPAPLKAIGVTSTSGTLCAVAEDGRPLAPAIMYNDSRSEQEARLVQEAGSELAASLGYRFSASFALPKLLWLRKHRLRLFAQAAHFISPTDFIIGWLTGNWGRTDQTNALKYGYDLLRERWPAFISTRLGLPVEKLPQVQTSGEEAGRLLPRRAAELGLPPDTPVAAGLTDGCASQISSGAVSPGEFNTTIGTTLVVKGVSRKLLLDPQGRIYCHRHPQGWWLPGGASNTGAECIAREFGPQERERLDRLALSRSPTGVVAYPLMRRGERFPFSCPEAEGFIIGEPAGRAELFTAYLEGVACLERLAFEVLEELGAPVGEAIYSAGGGSQSDAWLQIRADTLGRTILRPAVTGAAMGAAIIAAVMSGLGALEQAARAMVRIEREVGPRKGTSGPYEAQYERFKEECRRRGYLGGGAA